MNSKEIISERCYSGRQNELQAKHMFLAWLTLHYEGVVGHPDDRMDPECGYAGWYMIIAEKVFDSSAIDTLKYPSFLGQLKHALSILETQHLNDDDEEFLDRIQLIKDYMEDMDINGLKGMLDALKDLIQFHETGPEDVLSSMSTAYDTFSWISKR